MYHVQGHNSPKQVNIETNKQTNEQLGNMNHTKLWKKMVDEISCTLEVDTLEDSHLNIQNQVRSRVVSVKEERDSGVKLLQICQNFNQELVKNRCVAKEFHLSHLQKYNPDKSE